MSPEEKEKINTLIEKLEEYLYPWDDKVECMCEIIEELKTVINKIQC